ncbi:MAG: tripartite tricarboxylate transporter TctB family protein [Pseudomonadota bacterium]
MRRINADTLVAILLLAGSGALFRETFYFRSPPFETVSSSLWPRIVLAGLAALSLVYLIQSPRAAGEAGAAAPAGDHRIALYCFVLFALFLLSLPTLGMLIAGIAYVFLMQVVLGPRTLRNHVAHLAVAVVSVGGMWAAFRYALRVILPEGLFLRL